MVGRGHPVQVVTRLPGGDGPPLPASDPPGVSIARVRVVRTPSRGAGARAWRHFLHRYPGAALSLRREFRRARPDLIATHCSKFHAPYVAALRGLGVPIVVHLHNGARTADGPESLPLSRLLLRSARRVIAVSPAVADYARAVLPGRADRVVIVPNGVEPDEFASVTPTARPRPYILGVGALAERKGFDLLIDAVARADAALDLVLAGDGPERAALEARAAARGIAARTHFLGHVDRAAVAALLRGATVVASPSRFEGHPLICLEAMLAGAPLVVSDIEAFPEELRHGETGLRVPPEDVAALARTLAELAAAPARARALGHAAREAARHFPTWDEMTARVLAEYAAVTA
jgi:glycogen(starch) synthase